MALPKRAASTLGALLLLSIGRAAVAKEPELATLSADHFRDSASVTDDAGRDATVISTEPGYVERSLGAVWHDEYLKAFVDHKSGRKTFEIDVVVSYSGPKRTYRQAGIEEPAGSKTAAVMLLSRANVNCQTGDCVWTEHLAVPIEEASLRQMAAADAVGQARLYGFTLQPKLGRDYRSVLSSAEIAGFLARVDAYRPGASKPAPAVSILPPPRRLDFGISGFSAGPSRELPGRAGIVVVSVTPGSVADKAGVITGDIVHALDTRPVTTPADLETAVGEIAPGSRAVIHVFRGTAETALPAKF